jgi:hypothetical protein
MSVNRWWIYQKERFPVLANGILIGVFSFSAVSFSALLRHGTALPSACAIAVSVVNSFLAFLQLRIADEFKDLEEDTLYRSYRPVPRGLVTLRELGSLGVITGLIQLGLALWLDPKLLPLLFLTWLYLGLMSREFFVREWLKARPVTYLWTHMLIMPLIDFYATACDWLARHSVSQVVLPSGLFWFVVVSFFNGVVIEIGRKIRAPDLEETGVPTYTAIWGKKRAVATWLLALFFTAASAAAAAVRIDFLTPVIAVLGTGLSLATILAILFLRDPVPKWSRLFEPISGLWTIAMYLTLGGVPMLLRIVHLSYS